MSRSEILVAIDVGTTKIATIVGQLTPEGLVNILGVGTTPSKGLRKGIIVNVEETSDAIGKSIEEAERMAGYPCKTAFVGVAGGHIASLNSKGVIAVSRANGEITHEDVDRAIDAAQAISLTSNREILHVLPRSFIVDGQDGIKDPVSMSGVRLEVETHIVTGATSSLRNLIKAVNAVGVDVDGVVLNPIAAAQSVLTDTDKDIGCVLIDIGGGTTDISIFLEGSIWHTCVLPIGGNHITNDLAIGLRIPFQVAEEVKVKGYIQDDEDTNAEINLKDFGADDEQIVSQQILTEIISARVEEIFQLVGSKIRKTGYTGLLPGGAILTGGAAQMPGMVDLAKYFLKMPTRVGIPMKVSGFVEKVKNPAFSTAAGLLLWGQHDQFSGRRSSGSYSWSAVFSQFKDWVKRSFSI